MSSLAIDKTVLYQLLEILFTFVFSFSCWKWLKSQPIGKQSSFVQWMKTAGGFIAFWTLVQAVSRPLYLSFVSTNNFFIRTHFLVLLSLFATHIMRLLFQNPITNLILIIGIWTTFCLELTGHLEFVLRLLDRTLVPFGATNLSFLKLGKFILTVAVLFKLTSFFSNRVDEKLQTLPNMEASRRILTSKTLRTSLYIVAMFLGMSVVGIDLTAFAFFAGALGVGIGLGLQNLFANYFAGFILLLDRSIKLGDVVALEGEKGYGVVHKLNIRYVTIRTREGKEHLIPNEKFINSSLETWSYSDPYIRLEINFFVDYDSDVTLVEKLLIKVASATKRVEKRPEPVIRLKSMKGNAIEISIRVWISDPHLGLSSVKSDIIYGVWKEFRSHGIKVPYEPRSVYIESKLPTGIEEKI